MPTREKRKMRGNNKKRDKYKGEAVEKDEEEKMQKEEGEENNSSLMHSMQF